MTKLKLQPFPKDFPNKGLYRTWTSSWNPLGHSDTPQYSGQMPITFPEDASLLEIQFGGYFVFDA